MIGHRRILTGLLLGAAVLALLWATHPRPLVAMARWLDVGELPRPAEYVMVLNGGENTRPFVAAVLLNAGLARHVLVAKVAPPPETIGRVLPPSQEISRQVLLHRGVADHDIIILPAAAATTYDEAVALAAFLEDRPNTRVLIVTNDCHTRRSRWAFARALGDRMAQVSLVSAPSDDVAADCWWRDERGFVTIVTEYLKLAFYALRYGYAGYWLAACGCLTLLIGWVRSHNSTLAQTASREDG
jgi:uncharacterized SAM-binding protein YcdF (DUF218 family)